LKVTKINNWKKLSGKLILNLKDIYENSFPPDERRDFEKLKILCSNPFFSFFYILKDKIVIGFYTFWNFKDFNYIEHLAIKADFRGKGLGTELIKKIKSESDQLIVLEVEKPENTIAKKRVEFYESAGFKLCEFPYIQPPYSKDKLPVPMNLMTYPKHLNNSEFLLIKQTLYKEVYNVKI